MTQNANISGLWCAVRANWCKQWMTFAPSATRRALKDNATSFASNLHAHSIHQNSRNVKRARRGTEMIAEARLAHWLSNVQLELI